MSLLLSIEIPKAYAAELQLWNGYIFGMNKSQVELRLKPAQYKCEPPTDARKLVYCETSPMIPLGPQKARLGFEFDSNRKLIGVFLVIRKMTGCPEVNAKDYLPKDAAGFNQALSIQLKCNELVDADDIREAYELKKLIDDKYGVTGENKSSFYKWRVRGLQITLVRISSGEYTVIYRKDKTYDSL